MNGISTCKKSLVSFNRAVTSNKKYIFGTFFKFKKVQKVGVMASSFDIYLPLVVYTPISCCCLRNRFFSGCGEAECRRGCLIIVAILNFFSSGGWRPLRATGNVGTSGELDLLKKK